MTMTSLIFKKTLFPALVLLAIVPILGAQSSSPVNSGPSAVVSGNTQFALDLYQRLSVNNKEKNVFVSPFSISTALAMTYAGARNDTARQMKSVLKFPASQQHLHSTFADLIQKTRSTPSSGYRLNIANALWGAEGQHFETAFLNLVEKHYQGGFKRQNFRDPVASARVISDWAAERTEGKIQNVVGPEDVSVDTRLVLANAIYFKGDWAAKFDKASTKPLPFKMESGKTADVPTMMQSAKFPYYENAELQAIELPYAGERISMVVLLPKGKIDQLETQLSPDTLNSIRKGLRPVEVEVMLPKFKFDSRYHLRADLIAMGMGDAFDTHNADFSGMTGSKNLQIDDVIHQALIDVNEEGSEAAAVTVVVMLGKSLRNEPPTFRADHPFMFLILHKDTNSILFMGRFSEPLLQNGKN